MFLPPPVVLDDEEDDFESLGVMVVWFVGNVVGLGFGLLLAHLVAIYAVSAWDVEYGSVFGPAAVVLVIAAEIGCAGLAIALWFADERLPKKYGD